MRFETNKLKDDIWETDGEVIVIDNNLNEFKEYFVLGKKVDWSEYKKNRPEDRLDMDQLEKIKYERRLNSTGYGKAPTPTMASGLTSKKSKSSYGSFKN